MIWMHVERPGMHSMFQDLGRFGHQRLGVSVNGPMDEWSHRLANALVGNAERAAVLECTFNGPRVSFSESVVIALCGAAMNATIEGRRVPLDCPVYVRRGAVLDIGERISGARTYLAVRGELAVPAVLGSQSTNARAGFGGFHGRTLKKGDKVPFDAPGRSIPALRIEKYGLQSGLPMVCGRAVPAAEIEKDDAVRFMKGPHWSAFKADAHAAFTRESYTVSPQSDRMGLRLSGSALQLKEPLEVISEATVFGTVQVPPDGRPIVLMADRQSAGGYPKIAYVAGADLPRLAQVLPGESLRFRPVTQEEAEGLWLSFEKRLAEKRADAAAALAA